MKLTGPEIHKYRERGEIVIDPFVPENMGPNSYDLRLSPDLLVYKRRPRLTGCTREGTAQLLQQDEHARECAAFWQALELKKWSDVLDMAKPNDYYKLRIPETGIVLLPGRLYIGSTLEYTETHTLVPCIEGRSSVGRLGINIHSTAGFGDVGFCGTWTLEISVVEPVRVYSHVRIAQIYYEQVVGDLVQYKSDKYQGQRGPKPSGLWKDFVDEEARTKSEATTPDERTSGC